MSQNIKIKEGGKSITFGGLDRLIVPLSGGGGSQWVPKSTVDAPDKSIDKNGTYKAVSEGVYGWKQVSVSVQQSDHVTGKGPDGNDYNVAVDSGGNIIETKVPSEIRVTVLPAYLGPYMPGAYISFEGIVVHAYDGNGEDMGEVPFDELIFPTNVVHQLEEGDGTDRIADTGQGLGNWPSQIHSRYGVIYGYTGADHNGKCRYEYDGYIAVLVRDTDPSYPHYRIDAIYCSASPGTGRFGWQLDPPPGTPEQWDNVSVQEAYTHDGKTVYYNVFMQYGLQMYLDGGLNVSTEEENPGSRAEVAWAILYGNITTHGGSQMVPVQWARPLDSVVLETQFGIDVTFGPNS